MIKKIVQRIILFSFFVFQSCVLIANIIKSYGVDGSSNNVNVVIKSRNPVVFFEYDNRYIIASFEIKISTFENGLSLGNTVWHIVDSTSVENTLNFTTRVNIDNRILVENTTYFLLLRVYETNGSSQTVTDRFFTTKSALESWSDVKITLEVDQNNPFCPLQGEKTKIRYITDKDIPISIYIFSISGRLVRILNRKQTALKDIVYTIDWDGKDEEGNILPQGMYFVMLHSDGISPVVRLVGIIKERR
ncbi:MAG: hypothetical protein NZ928_07145 [Endomicrobia bacterium]|nr:hypothetical protein [Endomicrobiia bacterium]MDW8055951.1 hypothetical protein [Elusimicrobiota bacterium]